MKGDRTRISLRVREHKWCLSGNHILACRVVLEWNTHAKRWRTTWLVVLGDHLELGARRIEQRGSSLREIEHQCQFLTHALQDAIGVARRGCGGDGSVQQLSFAQLLLEFALGAQAFTHITEHC